MQRRSIPKEIRDEVVMKVKNGEKVADVAATFGISTKTIYGWLSKDSGSDTITLVKFNKIKRENEELKRIIGKLTLDMSWGKKE